FSGGSWTIYSLFPNENHSEFINLKADPFNNRLWFSRSSLASFDGNTWQFSSLGGLTYSEINTLQPGLDSKLWFTNSFLNSIGKTRGITGYIDGSSVFEQYNFTPGARSSFTFDAAGNVFVTGDRGFWKYAQGSWDAEPIN
ncbi:MAG: hypothetical protein AAFN81_35060, partial [Bacteroidota bacterium]